MEKLLTPGSAGRNARHVYPDCIQPQSTRTIVAANRETGAFAAFSSIRCSGLDNFANRNPSAHFGTTHTASERQTDKGGTGSQQGGNKMMVVVYGVF